MPSLEHSLKKVRISGFRSIKNIEIELHDSVNLFAGLNDHGKSNLFRAMHLFLTGSIEPHVPLNYENDICRTGGKAAKRIEIEFEFDARIAHEKLLKSIGRTQVQNTETFAVRKVWSRQPSGFSLRTDIVFYRSTKKDKRIYTDADYNGISNEKVIAPKAANQFREELDRLFERFRVRYLPANSTGTLFEEAGLATEVKRYLFDSYSKDQRFRDLGKSIKNFRDQFDEMVKSEFGTHIAKQLIASFPGLESADLKLPLKDEELVSTVDLNVHRDGKPVGISACGSGLQSVLVLETLKFLDSNIQTRSHGLAPIVVWLIEEPEAFLYEDLVHAVGNSLTEAAKHFTVLSTTHSRELVNSSTGIVNWITLSASGTTNPRKFDLSSDDAKSEFSTYASDQFGKSWLELQYDQIIDELNAQNNTKPLIFVEGASDETILKKLFMVYPISGGIEISQAITNSNSNAEHVMNSVIKISSMIQNRIIIGVFDNDHEGKKYHEKLKHRIESESLANCRSIILPCPENLKNAKLGVPLPDGKVVSSGQTVNLDGVAITIEALMDSDELLKLLSDKNYIEDFWLSSRGSKQTEIIYSNLTAHGKGKKTQLATDAASILKKSNAGSLNELSTLIKAAVEQ